MSRRIVQLAYGEDSRGMGSLYALDNNGVAWVLEQQYVEGVAATELKWRRLPELPSIDTRPKPPLVPVEP